ncbi:MAG TPA: ATP-binding protein, partial [Rhodocyclaceae bacterium]|nr:ATP-binding protein [Rhodocyclaceae bacterium]
GRTWTLRYTALPGFAAATRIDPPWVALLAIASVGFLVVVVVAAFVRSRRQQAVVAELAESLRRKAQALGQAQSVAHLGSWSHDLVTGQLSWSAETYRLFDVHPDTPPSREIVAAHLHPEDAAFAGERLEAARHGETINLEFRLVVDGVVRWVHVIAEPQKDAQGRQLAVIGTIQDITERRAMLDELMAHRSHLEAPVTERTRELESARETAETASRAKTNLLANLSHEFRTPMNAILGLTSLIRRDSADPEQVERLKRVMRAAENLLGMVDDLLELTRMDSAPVKLRADLLALDDLLTRSLHRAAEAAADKELTLASEVDPQLHLLYAGDAERLGRMIDVLVSNAVKFTDAGRVDVEARLAERRPAGDLIRIAVRDTGIGIAPEMQARLFEPFEQADSSMTRRHGGAGLGLAVLRRLAEAMGAHIGLESSPGEGSVFWFDVALPRADVPGLAAETVAAPVVVPPVLPAAPPPGPVSGQGPESAGEAAQDQALAALRAHPGLDVAAGLHAVRDRPASYLRLLRKLAESHRDDVATVHDLLAAGRREDARRTAHSLKGASGTLGALAIQDLARELEFAIRDELPAPKLAAIGVGLDAELARLAGVFAALPDAAAGPATGPDPAAVAVAAGRLLPLLAEDDAAACEVFRESATLFRQAYGEKAAELERLIAAFDFPAAHALLARLAGGAA